MNNNSNMTQVFAIDFSLSRLLANSNCSLEAFIAACRYLLLLAIIYIDRVRPMLHIGSQPNSNLKKSSDNNPTVDTAISNDVDNSEYSPCSILR